MRILMASHGYPPTVSGVTLVVQKLARAMVQRGHAVTVVTASDEQQPYETEDQGVQLVRVRSGPNPFWGEGPIPIPGRKDLEEVIDQVHPDIAHDHEAALLSLQLVRAGRDAGLPLLATCHYVPRFVARYLTWNDEPLEVIESITWAYSTWLLDHFDHVVFVTAAHRNSFLQKGLEAPTLIISNGVDTSRYHPPDGGAEDVEARYHLPPRPRILFAGRLAQDKEIDVLIKAMPSVLDRCEAHLLLVGRGDYRPELEEWVDDLDLGRWVHFLGFVPEEDMPALYRAVDLFAIAATTEVQSLPTLQAVATGLPVVAADAMALPELVHDGVNGFLTPPGDPKTMAEKMRIILCDPERARRMGQASLRIAAPHAETYTFDQYESLYRRLIARE